MTTLKRTDVLNLSKTELSPEQVEVLSLGLNFVPTQDFDIFTTVKDINKCIRSLTVKKHFWSDCPSDTVSFNQPLATPEDSFHGLDFQDQLTLINLQSLQNLSPDPHISLAGDLHIHNPSFYPVNSRTPAMDRFQQLVERDLRELHNITQISKKHSKNNIVPCHQKAIKELKNMQHLIIKMSDKGGMVVVLDKHDYHLSVVTMLDDASTYSRLDSNPTLKFQIEVKQLIQEGLSLGVLTDRQADYLYIDNPVIPIIHGLPKVHKEVTPLPLRPIISGINSLGETMSEWLDSLLQPLVKRVPGYIQDTKSVLKSFELKNWEQDFMWITCDVQSLYTCIPHKVALTALDYHVSKYSNYTQDLKGFMMQVTFFLMTHNYFVFDQKFYLQQRGVSMGAKFSPSLANLTMAWWEELYLFSSDNPFFDAIHWYGRYIDDLLVIWTGDVSAVPVFADYLNNNPFNLKFTFSSHRNTISFLDLQLTGTVGETINSATYRKPTSGNTLLHYKSHHPKHTTKSIPVGEFTRALRNCSHHEAFQSETKVIGQKFRDRGYPNWVINRAKDIVSKKKRTYLINHETDKSIDPDFKPTLVLEYNRQYKQIKSIVDKHLPIVTEDTTLEKILNKGWRTVSRKPMTIGNILSPSFFSSPSRPQTWLKHAGFYRCGTHPCRTCSFAMQCKQFQDSEASCTYNIKQLLNCNSTQVVYIILCDICNIMYVGCTIRKFKVRALEHINDISSNTGRNMSNASKHFVDTHSSNIASFKIFAIEKLKYIPRGGDIKSKLVDREAYWILMLNTTHPKGLNLRRESMLHY